VAFSGTKPWGETRCAYDANGDWIGLGTVSGGKLGTFDQAFDPVGRLTGQRYRPGGGDEIAWWRHVHDDAVGNPTRIADSHHRQSAKQGPSRLELRSTTTQRHVPGNARSSDTLIIELLLA
jgi:hypothetical protein